jgi:mannitol/fructose-specific phosphotransferase system IIA component (Ntr-type)
MLLTKHITKSCVVAELESKNKPDAIKELTHLLFEKKRMKNVSAALDQIIAREATESTGIGNGIAVPHARIPGMKNLACAVGRVTDGLDFMAVDRKPVHLILLICYPPAQQTTYLNFVATAAKLLSENKNLDSILKAKDEESIFNILEKIDQEFHTEHEETIKKWKTDPAIEKVRDGHADLILLARLQLQEEMLKAAKTGKTRIRARIDEICSMVEPRILKHYQKLMKGRPPALVPVEGDTCQGCFIRLPSKFVQQVREDSEHIHTCINCSRYIYVV